MKQVTGVDGTFLCLETSRAPMNLLTAMYFDVSTLGRPFDFGRYRKLVASRLHVSRFFRQRLVEVPMNLDYPYWIEDPDFKLDNHVQLIKLPASATRKEILRIAHQEIKIPFDRSKPLWKMIFIEGFEHIENLVPGSFVLLFKMHHAAIDGISGISMLEKFLDHTPDSGLIAEPQPWTPELMPSKTELLTRTVRNFAKKPIELVKVAPKLISSMQSTNSVKQTQKFPAHKMFGATKTRFNTYASRDRVFHNEIIPIKRIHHLKNATHATVNDVILTICAGGLRSYLMQKQELPEEDLIAAVPMSFHTKDEWGHSGNQVSIRMISLATQEADPLKRLERIRDHAIYLKNIHKASDSKTKANLNQFIPYALAVASLEVYSRLRICQLHKPLCNLTISNVPGPSAPRYFGGAKLIFHDPLPPLLDGIGLVMSIFSYNDILMIGAATYERLVPDMGFFGQCLRDSLEALENSIK
ncbi:wax ester/triacylglycerol synthase family O-acyltransferase [Deltaproteobacteria bacterium TL4]